MARAAKSLDALLAEVDRVAPNRSKASDGWIGDPAHATRSSDHNPDFNGIVHARDFTHDPRSGADMERLARTLQRCRDSRVKYVIWNRRIMSGDEGPSAWTWRPYAGENPHTQHLHLSVDSRPHSADGVRPWRWWRPTLVRGTKRRRWVWFLRKRLRANGVRCWPGWAYSKGLERKVKAFQSRRRLRPDGVVGPATWRELIES